MWHFQLMTGNRRPGLVLLMVLVYVCTYECGAMLHKVQVLTSAPGFNRATTDEQMDEIYRDNLLPDLAAFKSKSSPCHIIHLHSTAQALLRAKWYKHIALIVIKSGEFYVLPFAEGSVPPPSPKRAFQMVGTLLNLTRQGVRYPDTVFIMNFWDEPKCPPPPTAPGRALLKNDCAAPVFSHFKQWDWQAGRGMQSDILLPVFNHIYQDLLVYPWEQKVHKAMVRAAFQKGMDLNCSRLWLMHLASTTPDGQRLLDVGITNNQEVRVKLQLTPFLPMPEHARWKFLLSTDGFSASCRFGKLLQTNSVVLKEESPWIEYYYRSIQHGKHAVAFTKDNVMQVLLDLEKKPDAELQAIAAAGQQFSYTYLSQHAKAMYVRKALEQYNQLYGSTTMQRLVDALPVELLEQARGVVSSNGALLRGAGPTPLGAVLDKMKAIGEQLIGEVGVDQRGACGLDVTPARAA